MRERLAGASADARTPALLSLIEGLKGEELDELATYANKVRRDRKRR
jgi:hypothetical protein